MCIDYRKLNQKLVKDKFPLPLIEDVLDTLQEAKVYSTLDLRNGFFHVDVDEDCRKYTSFIVPDGQFEFNKVPFGLSTSPGVFQRYVSSIFRDLTRKGIVISYLDDLVIPAKDEKEGLEKLKIVFEVAKKYGLEIKFKKCQFLKKTIEFLGHVVENGTIKPSTAKTQAVQKFPEPTTIKQVQSFLGLTGYFRKYIKDYSTIAKPLSDLTRKENPFVFGTLQKVAFEKLKNIMSEGPLLHIYKYGRTELQEQREFLRNDAKKNIETIQSENRKTYNKRRKIAPMYKEGDLVAIQRTQFGTGLKLRPKLLGPYKITKVNSRDRYEVEKSSSSASPLSPVNREVFAIRSSSNMPDMQDLLFQLRFSSKQLERLSKRSEKDEKVQRNKIKKVTYKGDFRASKHAFTGVDGQTIIIKPL
ncbi:retrovirus-related Pol polyprotein from transposon 297 [Trichonephila inaurata madagascariensis]|uniref:Retrovirus-related Pol polyprotein from transposon 297 n=1 Tax=Trichonephila inaurata madagascariensis TaxID=2747483 RepID=A0A8X6JGM3_9ARAC|nr:retrovirus-related Pol polyprotein from transposon 297 [Trichonephila inaurata madagascariensis]